MAYAKPCKYCNSVQVIWDDKLQGSNKFKEVETGIAHSRDRCDDAKLRGGGYKIGSSADPDVRKQQKLEQETREKHATELTDVAIQQVLVNTQSILRGIDVIHEYLQDNAKSDSEMPGQDEEETDKKIIKLQQIIDEKNQLIDAADEQIRQLGEALKKLQNEKGFVPASNMPKNEEGEELEL